MATSIASDGLFVGLMSGTSMDSIDAALIRFDGNLCEVVHTHSGRYPDHLRKRLHDLGRSDEAIDADELHALDEQVGECFADTARALLDSASCCSESIIAIGSHGQTLRHEPDAETPFSLQVGNGALIADATGITTVNDFRSADVSAGGQGAPLAPAFHHWRFASAHPGAIVLNLGGIANITVLSEDPNDVIGFDTGPSNTLMDAWILEHQQQPFDRGGEWAAQGTVDERLLQRFLSDPYIRLPAPKSTGFEYFNLNWLKRQLLVEHDPVDVQATLCEFTARSVCDAITAHAPDSRLVLACGGGVHNVFLLSRLQAHLHTAKVSTTGDFGLNPEWVEAAAFAWLARRTLAGLPGNLPSVTGAAQAVVLGHIHTATELPTH